MITCPECGNPVSTMAGTCPQCGVRISGHIKQCTECGTYYFSSEERCPYCDHAEEAEEQEEITETDLPQEEEDEEKGIPAERKPKKGNVFLKALLWIIVLGAIAGSGYIGYQYYTDYTYRAEEKKRYEELEFLTTPDFYRQYLADYPQSIYAPDVEKRLQAILNESTAWDKTLQTNTKVGYMEFLESYPTSLQSRKCLQLIDSIDWAEACLDGTEEAMNRYLTAHPEGMYTNEAVDLKKNIDSRKTTAEEDEQVTGAVKDFFTAVITQTDKSKIEASIAAPMQAFCGTPKAGAQHILKFIKEKKTKDVTSVKFIVDEKFRISREKLYDNTTGYRAECLVEEIITRKTGKKKQTEKQYQAVCLLNGNFKFVKIELNQNKNQ